MTNEGPSLTANELWLLHTMLAGGEANPSDAGMSIGPDTIPAGSPTWPEVRAAVDGLVARDLIEATPNVYFESKGKASSFSNVRFKKEGFLLIRRLKGQKAP